MEPTPRLTNEEFFALPKADEVLPASGSRFGLAPQKDEGAHIYRGDGGDWLLQVTADGVKYRVDFV